MVLEAVYEQDFHDCSYGFRPGRSAHQALASLWQQTMQINGGWILDVDIQKYFDTLDHAHLRKLLRRRVRDGVLLRLIGKWLHAGVLEDGNLSYPEAGTLQGVDPCWDRGVISPLLSNVFLHYVLDEWFEQVVQPCLKGRAFLIRYADDFVMGFACEEDARQVLDVLPKRFGKYGLTLHPAKTRLVPFQRPPRRPARKGSTKGSPPGSFDLLGFTHYWARSQRGYWVVKLKTASDRFSRAVRSIDSWCRDHRHWSLKEQQQKLNEKLRGHYAYYGVTGNSEALSRFRWEVDRRWRKWLGRRNRERSMTWNVFRRLLQRYPLAPVRTLRSIFKRAAKP